MILASGVGLSADLKAVTLEELLGHPRLNAKRFAAHFGHFAYEFNSPIQPATEFLAREKGDCDDYAVLANHVLSQRGFHTRLIHVRLTGRVAHAVCYVTESKGYLDYNNRSVFFSLTRSGPDLREIASKVAQSLEASWTTASEFTYSYATRRKTMIATVSQTGTAEPSPSPPSSAFNVD
ncbi:MAG TPA: transglutaminase-like domain-containing protein [Lacunisphaera sp.]|nr:transglutaminase-like domain-containing protein [Lacunisphaera sp.]